MFETAEARPVPIVRGSAFGLDLATGAPLSTPLAPVLGEFPPLRVVADHVAPPVEPPFGGVRFAGQAEFRFWQGRVGCRLTGSVHPALVEIMLMGRVLATWLELQGIVVLHASAVVVDGRAVAFLASNRGGKTSLAASFVAAGHPLLTDDVLPVDEHPDAATARPGYPQMRMWPSEAVRFTGSAAELPRVHPHLDKRRVAVGPAGFGSFDHRSRPLARLYLPSRVEARNRRVKVRAASPAEAVVELVRHSFAADLVADRPALVSRRVATLGRIAERVPVRHLEYASGYDRLGAVRDAVLRDLEAG